MPSLTTFNSEIQVKKKNIVERLISMHKYYQSTVCRFDNFADEEQEIDTLVASLDKLSYIIHSADYILFQSFEIRGYILNNQKILIGLDACFRPSFFNPLGHFWFKHIYFVLTIIQAYKTYTLIIQTMGLERKLKAYKVLLPNMKHLYKLWRIPV